jgi:hypothetical protein
MKDTQELTVGQRQISALARSTESALLIAATAVGAALRLAQLTGHGGITGDEAINLALTQHSFGHMLHLFRFEPNGSLYPIIEWPLIRVFPHSLLTLRLPAVIAGIATVPALYWAGKRIVGSQAALLAAGLMAVSPLAVSYSQLAKPYALAALFGTLAFGCLARACEGRRWWVAYVATMTLATYSHVTVLALLVAQAVLVPASQRRRWIWSLGALLVMLTPLILLLHVAARTSKGNGIYWLDKPSLSTGLHVAEDFVSGRTALALATVIVIVAAATRARDRQLAVAAAWAILAPAALFVVAQAKPVFWIGYTVPALSGAMLLVALAITRLPKPFAIAAALLLGAIFVQRTVEQPDFYHAHGAKLAALALASERHGSPVIFDIPDGLAAAGFYDRSLAPNGRLVVSEWGDPPPPGVSLLDDPGGYGRAPTGPPTETLIERLTQKTGTLFIMFTETTRQGDVTQSAGLRWAAGACKLTAAHNGGFLFVRISGCGE